MKNSSFTVSSTYNRRRLISVLFATFGLVLMVMLADTYVGSIITATQSGTQWGYEMILPQILLFPILNFVQEVTVRLGLVTGKGRGGLIWEKFGVRCAFVTVIPSLGWRIGDRICRNCRGWWAIWCTCLAKCKPCDDSINCHRIDWQL